MLYTKFSEIVAELENDPQLEFRGKRKHENDILVKSIIVDDKEQIIIIDTEGQQLNYIPECHQWTKLERKVNFQYILDNDIKKFKCVDDRLNRFTKYPEDRIYTLNEFFEVLGKSLAEINSRKIMTGDNFIPIQTVISAKIY